MFTLLLHTYIKDDNYQNNENRLKVGTLCALLCIIGNIICVLIKLIIGFIVHSYSIMSDGFNNLSDMGSNLVSLLGFKLSNKHPDTKHPYGHGRYEYLMGLFMGCFIIIVGVSSLIESLKQIIHPTTISFSYPVLLVLTLTMGIKFWMYRFNTTGGKLIESQSLIAVGKDSLNDILATLGTLIAYVSSLFTTFPLDGLMGSIVSVLVILNGLETFKSMMDALLGEVPDYTLIHELNEIILKHNQVIGIHDFMMHDYGPGRRFLVVHLELPHTMSLDEAHQIADHIEREILEECSIMTTIHIDPVNLEDKKTQVLKQMITDIVKNINKDYSIHDFRVINGTHTRLIFDVMIPSSDHIKESDVEKKIVEAVHAYNNNYECIIQFDHNFY